MSRLIIVAHLNLQHKYIHPVHSPVQHNIWTGHTLAQGVACTCW